MIICFSALGVLKLLYLLNDEFFISQSVAWRKKYGMDEVVANWTPPEAMQKYYPGGVCGFDKGGSPVYISPFGRIDMRGNSLY